MPAARSNSVPFKLEKRVIPIRPLILQGRETPSSSRRRRLASLASASLVGNARTSPRLSRRSRSGAIVAREAGFDQQADERGWVATHVTDLAGCRVTVLLKIWKAVGARG